MSPGDAKSRSLSSIPLRCTVYLFIVSLPGQLLFGVTSMTLAAVTTTYLFGLVYFRLTGTYFFIDSYVPIAVFLGMHLLFTDPSTSPRAELGRLMFGAVYGLSVVGLYALLTAAGLPTFYDKLLQVPLMNLSVRFIDRLVQRPALRHVNPEGILRRFTGYRRNLAYVCLWGVLFVLISATGGLGDRHPGQWLPFWQEACRQTRPRACSYAEQLEATLCRAGSGWACNELGILKYERDSDSIGALASWQRGCEIGFGPACANAGDGGVRTAAPRRDRLSNPSAGKQGTDRGVVPASAVRSGVSTAVGRCLSNRDRTAMTRRRYQKREGTYLVWRRIAESGPRNPAGPAMAWLVVCYSFGTGGVGGTRGSSNATRPGKSSVTTCHTMSSSTPR